MYFRPRHRHGTFPLAGERTIPGGVRLLIAAAAVLTIGYLVWTLLLHLLGISGALARVGVFLTVEERGTVSIEIDGKMQRAENAMLLFPDESVSTGPGAHASLQFFDGSRVRLDDGTEVTIDESGRGETQARIAMTLNQGKIWLMAAAAKSFTGSITRTVNSSTLTFQIPSGTEAELSPTSVTVYTTEGEGVEVTLSGHDPFVISEGQQWLLPANAQVSDVYDHRSPIDPLTARSSLTTESRTAFTQRSGSRSSAPDSSSSELLSLTLPLSGAVVTDPTIAVRGTVGAGVTRVLVNGYLATLDATAKTFTQEVAPPEGTAPFEITVQALDDARAVLAEVRRTVTRAPAPLLAAPTVTAPARDGQTYHTFREELILRGTAPAGARGILVNDYRLQLFEPVKGEWSYIASLRLHNMSPGTNTYDVVALDASGRKSPAARLTIIQGGEGPEGVVSTGSSSSAASAASPLPQNAPLLPGSLKIELPTPGMTHTETGTGFLMIGATAPQTASISVNDYTLQLYRPGKTVWNYIVDVGINNLRRGKNTYKIVARNKAGEILDAITYAVQYEPK